MQMEIKWNNLNQIQFRIKKNKKINWIKWNQRMSEIPLYEKWIQSNERN